MDSINGWIRDEDDDAEYNQYFMVVEEKQFILHSDRDGAVWSLVYPNEKTDKLDADNIVDATVEASKLVQDYNDD